LLYRALLAPTKEDQRFGHVQIHSGVSVPLSSCRETLMCDFLV
jgi:hypothetical protein